MLRRAKAGDENAVHEVCNLVAPRLRAYFAAQLPEAVEDAVQEVLARLLSRLRSGEFDEEKFDRLMWTIARNVRADFLREKEKWRRHAADLAARDAAGREPSPEREEARMRVWAAVDALPDDQREAVLLRFRDGLPYKKIARALGTTPTGARLRVGRALTKLRRVLQGGSSLP